MTKTKKIYVAIMSTGEYEDHCEYNLMAFTNKTDADQFSDRANANLKAVGLHSDETLKDIPMSERPWLSMEGIIVPQSSLSAVPIDYTGARVSVESVQIFNRRKRF